MTKTSPATKRYLELDLLRSLAVLCMIVYHAAYDLGAFYGWDLDVFSGGWRVLQRGTAGLFLLIVGISFAISWSRHRARNPDAWYRKYLRRGLLVLACGMLVSVVTSLLDPGTFVRFGILHLIGVTILVLPFFTSLREGNAVVGVLFLLLGPAVTSVRIANPVLVPFGIVPPGWASVDYFPLVPWLGVPLLGLALGHLLYVRAPGWRWWLPPRRRGMTGLTWPGRHALWIYLLHQPVLLLILTLALGPPKLG